MPTNQTSSADTAAAVAQNGACAPCDIPAFCRSYFYTGKLLTEGDLNREQRYAMDKLRLHHVALHGWGVVCGLMVRPHPQCPDRFVVTEGLAIDDCGREIRLTHECVVHFPKPPEPPHDPCRPDDDDDDEDDERERREAHERHEQYERHEEHEHRKPRRRTYYVCIEYSECKEDFMPVVFDECCGTPKKPNRVCECAEIRVTLEPPECLKHIEDHRRCGCEEDCHKLWERIPEHCPPSGKVCCIPLAVIREYTYCESLTEEMIDNSIRPVLPSATRLEQLIHCLMDRLPREAPRLTHIVRFGWDHDREYSHGEFMREFVGTHESAQGFEIEFDRRVLPKGLNARAFRATVVREAADSHEPRHMEMAPARVHRSDDGLRCVLHIDPDYARRHLHEHNFDLFITLHCDKVIDEHGLAVDGDLMADLPRDDDRDYAFKMPTGNGIAGGLFESWIRVRRGR